MGDWAKTQSPFLFFENSLEAVEINRSPSIFDRLQDSIAA